MIPPAQALKMFTPHERFLYEERAAIKEFDGKMPRAEAERAAIQEVLFSRKP